MRIKFFEELDDEDVVELDDEDVVELDPEARATIKRADMYRYQNMLIEKLEEVGDNANIMKIGMKITNTKKEDVFIMIPFIMSQLDEFIFGE